VLVLVLLAVTAQCASTGTLYAVATLFSKNESMTLQFTLAVNPNTGDYTKIVENFAIGGSSETEDGISSFDDDRGVFYYAPNWPVPFVFSADVKLQKLLAPLYLGGTSVLRLDYDDAGATLYTLLEATQDKKAGGYLIATAAVSGSTREVMKFPSEFDFSVIAATDVYNSNYYLMAMHGKNTTSYELATFNLTDTSATPNVTHIHGCKTGYVEFMVLDQSSSTFYAVTETLVNSKLSYYLWTFDQSGTCQEVKIPIPEGIVTCFTYDQTNDIVWMALAPNGPTYLYGFDVSLKVIYKAIMLEPGLLPVMIEWSATH